MGLARVGVCLTVLVVFGRVLLLGAGGSDGAPVAGAVGLLSVGDLRAGVRVSAGSVSVGVPVGEGSSAGVLVPVPIAASGVLGSLRAVPTGVGRPGGVLRRLPGVVGGLRLPGVFAGVLVLAVLVGEMGVVVKLLEKKGELVSLGVEMAVDAGVWVLGMVVGVIVGVIVGVVMGVRESMVAETTMRMCPMAAPHDSGGIFWCWSDREGFSILLLFSRLVCLPPCPLVRKLSAWWDGRLARRRKSSRSFGLEAPAGADALAKGAGG